MTDERSTETPTLHERGMRVRREVLGDAHVDRAVAAATSFTAPFQDFITRYAWGDIWSRPGLDRRTRSCITLAVLTALHCRDEVGMHVRAALRNGLTPEEIQEVLLHTAVYAGVPAANEAFATARCILDEEGRTMTEPDDATAGSADAEQAAENVCPQCSGIGKLDGATCPTCDGSGTVVEIVGDA